jgi:hypothetical protein
MNHFWNTLHIAGVFDGPFYEDSPYIDHLSLIVKEQLDLYEKKTPRRRDSLTTIFFMDIISRRCVFVDIYSGNIK